MKMLANPITNIPKLKNSHTFGWAQIWADQLNAAINHKCDDPILATDTVYIEHGVNFGGTLNLFGGATEELYDRINRVMSCNNVISLDIDMPDWGEQLGKRMNAATTFNKIDAAWCQALSNWCKNIKRLRQQDLTNMTGISVGDSHTPSFSNKNDIVLRENGRTLIGALKRGIESDLNGLIPTMPITLCYGSIDIRHHLLRLEGKFDIKDLIKKYVDQGKELEKKYKIDVSYCAPVPVEYEGRKLPKTGYFKGKPFWGCHTKRKTLTFQFISELEAHKVNIVKPPQEWYTMDSEKYAKEHMEANSSVHISPVCYRKNNWGQTQTLEDFM